MRQFRYLYCPVYKTLPRILAFGIIFGFGITNIYSAGEFWHQLGNGLAGTQVLSLAIVPQSPSTIYVGTYRGLYKSTNGGTDWTLVSRLIGNEIYAVALDPTNPSIVYVTGGQAGGYQVFKSIDGGVNWTVPTSGSIAWDIQALAINPHDPRILYAGTQGGGVFKSSNGGATWNTANDGLSANFMNVCTLAVDPQNPAIVYAGVGDSGVYKSLDGGGTWTFPGSGLENTYVQTLVIDSVDPSILYAGTMLGGIFKSIDGGHSWNSIGLGISFADIRSLAIDAANHTTLYAGSNGGGLFKSTDGGGTWSALNAGLTNLKVYALAIDPTIPQKLYAGSWGNGVFAYPSPYSSLDFSVNRQGAASSKTTGYDNSAKVGYASLAINAGGTPYGTAVFSYRQNGITLSEAAVPASTPTTHARIFIDYRSYADAVPGRSEGGKIDVYTGISLVNCGSQTASIGFTLRNSNAGIIAVGSGTIEAGHHAAKFINQFKDIAAGFELPADFQTATQFASLEVSSNQPLSITALRMTINQRYDVIYTTTPVADLTQAPGSSPIYFAHFADGGGYTSSVILLNTSGTAETGILQILDNQGTPVAVHPVGGVPDSSFRYTIPSGGVYLLRTDGFPAQVRVGWVKLTPDPGTSTPAGSGLFGYNPANILVSESGIPAALSTTHARVYVDLSGNHDTGLAVANVGTASAVISINAFQEDGFTAIGTSKGPLQLAGNGHDAKFADQLISSLPAGFKGVLDISSNTPFAALTIRSLDNENHDFLMTTFPVADMTRPAPFPIVFPHIVDGGGYVTEFILLSPTSASSSTLNFLDDSGVPLKLGNQP